jgi:hypothetical protein
MKLFNVICYMWYVMRCISYMLYVICYMLYVICYMWSDISYLLSLISYLLYVICYMLYVINFICPGRKFFKVICYMLNIMYCICYVFLWVSYDCWWSCVHNLPCSALFCNEHMIALIRSYSIDEMIEARCSIEWHVFQRCSIFAEASIDQMIETYRTISGCSMTELPYHGMWPALS